MSAPRPSWIVCDAGSLPPDAASIHALALLQLRARRQGLEIRLRDAPSELLDLIDLAGLRDVLRVEAVGQPEEREQRLGVEEERELDDPAL